MRRRNVKSEDLSGRKTVVYNSHPLHIVTMIFLETAAASVYAKRTEELELVELVLRNLRNHRCLAWQILYLINHSPRNFTSNHFSLVFQNFHRNKNINLARQTEMEIFLKLSAKFTRGIIFRSEIVYSRKLFPALGKTFRFDRASMKFLRGYARSLS